MDRLHSRWPLRHTCATGPRSRSPIPYQWGDQTAERSDLGECNTMEFFAVDFRDYKIGTGRHHVSLGNQRGALHQSQRALVRTNKINRMTNSWYILLIVLSLNKKGSWEYSQKVLTNHCQSCFMSSNQCAPWLVKFLSGFYAKSDDTNV